MINMWYQVRQVEVSQMAARDREAEGGRPAGQQVAERTARFVPGLRMLVLGLVILAAGVTVVWLAGRHSGDAATALIWLGALVLAAGVLVLRGLTAIVPGRAHMVQLFGKYRGTIRESGLQWVNPFTNRIVVSTRIRNQESAQLKVNDADGNPIEIAAVVVWLVRDTAHAIYAVDDYRHFVTVQTETAQAMLRQQQASAVVGARQRIVEGAVGMVQLALQRLEEEGVVDLDEERKAAMVSNLLVVLCSEQATQQVVNTGSLYH